MLIGPSELLRHEEGVVIGHSVEELCHKAAYDDVRVASLASPSCDKNTLMNVTRWRYISSLLVSSQQRPVVGRT